MTHYEYYDGSSWCGKPGKVAYMWHPVTSYQDHRESLGTVDCEDCLEQLKQLGKAAERQHGHLRCMAEAKAKAAWIIP